MERKIITDVLFLSQVSQAATQQDVGLAVDLEDTLHAHKEACVGLAANMIGVQKRAIIVSLGIFPIVMFNPVLKKAEDPYQTEEGCLSLVGTRPTRRFQTIEVAFRDKNWKEQTLRLTGFEAQICQHELDHLEGRII